MRLRKRSCARWQVTSGGRSFFPLSNPTERGEATPRTSIAGPEGRAVIGTGSPFPPIQRKRQDIPRRSDQQRLCLSRHRLGAIVTKARRISDGMFLAARTRSPSGRPPKRDPQANLLAPLVELRELSFQVALAVARAAQADGVADPMPDEAIAAAVSARNVGAGLRDLPALARLTEKFCGGSASTLHLTDNRNFPARMRFRTHVKSVRPQFRIITITFDSGITDFIAAPCFARYKHMKYLVFS